MQNAALYSSLWYVQSMEVDWSTGLMWVIDVGRLNIFDTAVPVVNGPPKLLLLDLTTGGAVVHTFIFPDSVASCTASFLNDIVVDHTRGVAYISDAGTGAIVVYDLAANAAWRLSSTYTQADPAALITINGIPYPMISAAEDGIAYDPLRDVVYFCPLRGSQLFSIAAPNLRNAALTDADFASLTSIVGPKPPSDGLAFSSNGNLYYGDLNTNALYEWTPGLAMTSARIVAQNSTTMQWIDTFAFDEAGNLLFTTNRLQLYFTQTLNLTDVNMRIFSIPINGKSYLDLEPAASPAPGCPAGSSRPYTAGDMAGLAIGCLTAGVLLSTLVAWCYRRQVTGRTAHASNAIPYQPFHE